MQLNDQKEQFSLAYVHVVATRAGYQLEIPSRDRASVDGEISSDEGLFPAIKFQAKSATDDLIQGDSVVYDLNVKNYNDLRVESRETRLLILVSIPSNIADWTSFSADALCLHCTAYWHSLRGQDPSSNASAVRLRFPRTQLFDPDQLPTLMRRVEVGEL